MTNESIFHSAGIRLLNSKLRLVCFLCVGAALVMTSIFWGYTNDAHGRSGRNLVIVRDTEIETILKHWSKPVIEAAGLKVDAIKFILIQSPQINAFVAGGQNIFLYTGLLQEAESAEEVVGVIAHELGHIRGGHLIRTQSALENASYEALVGTIIGIGAALVTGEGGLAAAASAGFGSSAQNRFLAFSRVQESTADQAALSYFEDAGLSPVGLVNFMEKLEDQELLPASQQTEYIRTHPLTRDRVAALKHGYDTSPHKNEDYPRDWEDGFARVKAKLDGFIYPEQIQWKYDDNDKSLAADYARAIAAYRLNKEDAAIKLVDSLLAREKFNPFFLELKGQMLVDFGKVEEALPYYKESIERFPYGALIRISYGHALIESAGQDNEGQLKEAIVHLQRAARDERRSPRVFRLLATAYGRLGETAWATLYLAEEALLIQRFDYALRQAETSLKGLEEGSTAWLRAQDIVKAVKTYQKNAE